MTDSPTKDILAAICAAMGQVHRVEKDGRNKHDGYNFASIDDFLALVNPICAANGLIPHMQETAREDFERKGKFGDNAWMRQSFEITLMHVSGQTLPPVTRTVEVLRNGAQAYGSAQSYALKQFWRSLLLIPTGDKDDADYAPTDAGTISKRSGPTDAHIAHEKAVNDALAMIESADSLDDLRDVFTGLAKGVQADPRVIKAKDAQKAKLQPPITDDEIPY
jgi:hypothetical protein